MPNGLDVSGVCTTRGGATKVLPRTSYNTEWARCQRDEHDEGGWLRPFYVLPAMPNGPDVSGMSSARGGVTKVLPLTSCNAE